LAALRRDEPQLCIAAIFLSISNLSPMVIDVLFDLLRRHGGERLRDSRGGQ
jgi:hypothetical protein